MRTVTVIAALWCLAAQGADSGDDVISFDSDHCQRYRYALTGNKRPFSAYPL